MNGRITNIFPLPTVAGSRVYLAISRLLIAPQVGALRKLCTELDPQTAECSAAARDAF
ncbi:MAG: hypothetical protein OXH99_22640 [Bryobacterales bacterium]|nr:hypothetical protein [Bryobacterales bacterium]